jgi:hypothetical protein
MPNALSNMTLQNYGLMVNSILQIMHLMNLLTGPCAVQVSNDGTQFAVTSPDRRIRVFWFKTGKLRRVYDESLDVRNSPLENIWKAQVMLLHYF